jgi:hypothetical protein
MYGKYIATAIMPFFHINPAMMTVATVTDFLHSINPAMMTVSTVTDFLLIINYH